MQSGFPSQYTVSRSVQEGYAARRTDSLCLVRGFRLKLTFGFQPILLRRSVPTATCFPQRIREAGDFVMRRSDRGVLKNCCQLIVYPSWHRHRTTPDLWMLRPWGSYPGSRNPLLQTDRYLEHALERP